MSSEWKQLNKSVWQRVYPCGTVGIVRNYGNSDFTADTVDDAGVLDDIPTSISCFPTPELAQQALDAIFFPKPDFEDRTETSTYYRKGERAAFVKVGAFSDEWFASISARRSICGPTREAVEEAALSYVLGQS